MASMIVAGARTPVGKFGGVFKDVPAVTLGGHAIRAALERSRVAADQVDYVIMGQVLQAGAGQITARPAAIQAGIPPEGPAITINKVCLSGLKAFALGPLPTRSRSCRLPSARTAPSPPAMRPRSRTGRPRSS